MKAKTASKCLSKCIAVWSIAALGAYVGAGVADEIAGDNYSPSEETPHRSTLAQDEVTETITLVADWALENPEPLEWVDPASWVMAPLYDGLIETTLRTGDPRYLAAVAAAGQCIFYRPGSRTYHADGHAAARSWLRLYQMQEEDEKASELLKEWVDLFDEIVENPITERWRFGAPPPLGRHLTDRWVWTDALYMSPPTIVILAQITEDERYLQFMDSEYAFAYEELFDPEENLFYRDALFIDQRTPNGEKVFWSRGNGWVYGGLALVLKSMPEDYSNRDFYVELFQRMTSAVVAAQQPDGFWYPSLKDPDHVPTPEVSGTGLFILGLAEGIRQGLLDPETYWPVIDRGWNAIVSVLGEDGEVDYVQPPAPGPATFDEGSSIAYGTGAVLEAGTAILDAMLGIDTQIDPMAALDEAEPLIPTARGLSINFPCQE